jgi:plasmid segregation protein ParM
MEVCFMFYTGIDMGKDATKEVVNTEKGEKQFYVKTKVEITDSDEIINGNTYLVEHKGVKYLIGEEVSNNDYDLSKAKINHRMTMYLAIGKMIDKENDVRVITGCPLLTFVNHEAREQYKNYLLEERYIDMKINNERKKFNLIDVKVFPESIGYVYQNPDRNMNRLIAVIDCGGLNINGAVYRKLKPIKETVFTINEGGNILLAKLKRELNKQLQTNYQDYEISHLLNDEYYGDDKTKKKISEIINYVLKSQIDRILEEAKKCNWSLNGLEIAFTGGGSLILEKVIKEKIPNAIVSKYAVWDNANAYYKIGGILNG